MAMALFLRRCGIDSEIFELRHEDYNEGDKIALAPNALRVLDHLGLYEQIREHSFSYEEVYMLSDTGRMLGFVYGGNLVRWGYKALRIKRKIVIQAMRKEMQRQGIVITFGKKVVGAEENSEQGLVQVRFDDGDVVIGSMVIAADGMHSALRNYVDPKANKPQFMDQVGVMGKANREELRDLQQFPCIVLGQTGAFGLLPCDFRGSEVSFFGNVEMPERQQWDALAKDKSALHDILLSHFASPETWPKDIEEICRNAKLDDLGFWPFYTVPSLEKYHSANGLVVLIGDAAHGLPPTGGQGAAQALEDAETLSYTLAEIRNAELERSGADNDEVLLRKAYLAAWGTHRTQRVAKILDVTNKSAASRRSSTSWIEKEVKEWIIWAALKWMGPDAGAGWLFGYAAESVKSHFVSL
ncbi:uncharacterized protein PV09_08417 [Verruconis gallopava]|uniref:FAD-binding domain-containing protein n=1 Tax=Verruconis gallopava TaxID=253628 RepID=A0A0D2A195_9PEZI|nr:uncharacterized protein PV09_08417 [Verruconis gallopava]KIW00075.1 hypothetical protein PV09_08417 [Verruconis gallopava]